LFITVPIVERTDAGSAPKGLPYFLPSYILSPTPYLLTIFPVPLARRYPDCWPAIHPYSTTPAFPIICNDLYVFEMALLSAEHLAGPGYIILNVMRGLNIVALASVVASSIVMLVKTFVVSKVSLQDVVSQLEANTR
jgi:hypothetical protein